MVSVSWGSSVGESGVVDWASSVGNWGSGVSWGGSVGNLWSISVSTILDDNTSNMYQLISFSTHININLQDAPITLSSNKKLTLICTYRLNDWGGSVGNWGNGLDDWGSIGDLSNWGGISDWSNLWGICVSTILDDNTNSNRFRQLVSFSPHTHTHHSQSDTLLIIRKLLICMSTYGLDNWSSVSVGDSWGSIGNWSSDLGYWSSIGKSGVSWGSSVGWSSGIGGHWGSNWSSEESSAGNSDGGGENDNGELQRQRKESISNTALSLFSLSQKPHFTLLQKILKIKIVITVFMLNVRILEFETLKDL